MSDAPEGREWIVVLENEGEIWAVGWFPNQAEAERYAEGQDVRTLDALTWSDFVRKTGWDLFADQFVQEEV